MAHLRRHARFNVSFPVAIDAPEKGGRVGVVRNVSASGFLLGTPSQFRAGQRVRVSFKSRRRGPSFDVPGTIVRVGLDPTGEWLGRLVAVELDREVSSRRLGELAHSYAPR
jgi:PilZ domain